MTETTPALVDHTIAGDVRVHEAFSSRYLGRERTIAVYLPPNYDPDSADRYPVLYLPDGQNIFGGTGSIGEEWRVDEVAQELITGGQIEPLIVVGIYSASEHRIDEYTPTARSDAGGGGHADDYGRMLIEDLKPFIDDTYKTLPSFASTAIGGASLGGLLAMHLALRYPTAIGRVALLSPAVWWDDRILLREVQALPRKLPLRVWLDGAAADGEHVIPDARALRDALLAKGWVAGEDLVYVEDEAGEHLEGRWAARIGAALKDLFPVVSPAPSPPEARPC